MAAVARAERRADSTVVWLAFATFIGLGVSSGLRGVAWPSMRDEFGLPADGLGVLIFMQTLGYILSSFFSGRVATRLGNGRTYFLASGVMGLGLLASFAAPSWVVFIVSGFVIGAASGLIDAGLNNYMAAYYGPRQMNWLHACFGIGWTIGPLMMTTIVNASLSWRVGYGVSGALLLILTALYLVTLRHWRDSTVQTSSNQVRAASLTQTLRQPLLWLSVALFMVYAGMEVGAGDWSYTLFTDGRGILPEIAGLWVTVYSGSFTVGRLLFGAVSGRFSINATLRWGMAGSALGALLWWLNITDMVGFIGLALLGFSQAPLFPLLILGTAERLGPEHAANAIGFQVSAAGVGIAILPALLGMLVARMGYDVITPFILVLALLVYALHELTLLTSAARRRAASPAGAD
jgi:fucose permease